MNINDFERIESYLSGHMSSEECIAFETELAQDKSLADAFSLYRSIEAAMRSKHREDSNEGALKQTLKDLGAAYFTPISDSAPNDETNEMLPSLVRSGKNDLSIDDGDNTAQNKIPKKAIPLWIQVAVAVSIAGIIVLSATWLLRQKASDSVTKADEATHTSKQSDPEEKSIAEKTVDTVTYKRPAPSVTVQNKKLQRDSSNTLSTTKREALFSRFFKPDTPPEKHDDFLNDAFGFYQRDNYSKAIAAFEDVASTSTTRGETPDEVLIIFQAQYYQGLSYLAFGNTSKAITMLKKASIDDPTSKAKVQWYLALAYLKNDQRTEAHLLLTRLAQMNGAKAYRQKAESLLQAIDE